MRQLYRSIRRDPGNDARYSSIEHISVLFALMRTKRTLVKNGDTDSLFADTAKIEHISVLFALMRTRRTLVKNGDADSLFADTAKADIIGNGVMDLQQCIQFFGEYFVCVHASEMDDLYVKSDLILVNGGSLK